MALTRRQALLDRNRQVNRRDAKIFLIATEGAETERAYFEAFNPLPEDRVPFATSPVHVEVVPPFENRSAPQHVLAQVRALMARQGLDPRDEVWLVVDRDTWESHVLARMYAGTRRGGFSVADFFRVALDGARTPLAPEDAIRVSRCGLWFCWHFPDCANAEIGRDAQGRQGAQNLKRLWRRYLPPSATRIERTILRPLARVACERAVESNTEEISPAEPWPAPPGTQVQELVRRILEAS